MGLGCRRCSREQTREETNLQRCIETSDEEVPMGGNHYLV